MQMRWLKIWKNWGGEPMLINGRTPEEIKRGLYAHSQETLDCKECPYDGESRMDCSELMCLNALALIQHLEAKQPKWISTEERLPEEAGKYIVCTRKMAVYCTAFRFFHEKGYFATDSNTHITHWMPLPEPKENE